MFRIGILKETMSGEKRVILLPSEVKQLVGEYDVYVEEGAGCAVGYSDETYIDVGAIIATREECWKCDFVLKYKAPTKEEYKFLNNNVRLAAIFHAEGDYDLLKALKERKVTAYSYEFFRTEDGYFPMAYSGGEIAGKMAALYAMFYSQKQYGGSGKILFSVRGAKSARVAVIGYGNVGGAAIKMLTDMGNDVYVFGTNVSKMRKLSPLMGNNVICLESNEDNLKQYLPQMDAIIGAILISTYDTEPIITEEIFEQLKPGTVVIDVTCGYGKGYIPSIDRYTSLENPVYCTDNGIVCCKIGNLPSAYPVSTTEAYSRNACEWIKMMLDNELRGQKSSIVEHGKIFDDGVICHEVIKQHWDYYEKDDIRR